MARSIKSVFLLAGLVVLLQAPAIMGQPASWVTWYTDSFSDGTHRRWEILPAGGTPDPAASWTVESEGGNFVYVGRGHIHTRMIQVYGGDFRYKVRVKLVTGNLNLNFRSGSFGRYFVNFNSGGVALLRSDCCHPGVMLQNVPKAFATGVWHTVEIYGVGATITVKVNGVQEISHVDVAPVLIGQAEAEVLSGEIRIDDVETSGPPLPPTGPVILNNEHEIPRAAAGVFYSFALTGAHGTPPYTWSAPAGGGIPAGLSLSGAGLLSGTVATPGRYKFVVKLSDSAGNDTFQTVVLPVDPLAITTDRMLPPATSGVPYNADLQAAGIPGPYNWSADWLPQGLSLNPATGVISGTPTGAGNGWFYVTVASGGATATKMMGIYVLGSPLQRINSPDRISNFSAGWREEVGEFSPVGGTPPFTWTVSSGNLPPGMEMLTGSVLPSWSGPHNMVIGGWPTAPGTYTFTLTVTDSTSASVSRQVTLSVSWLRYHGGAPNGSLGEAYPAYKFQAGGGVPPHTFTAISNLPAGMTLSAAGVLSGTPQECGRFYPLLRVYDSMTPTADILTKQTHLFISCGTPVSLQMDESASITGAGLARRFDYYIDVWGGTGIYTYALGPGSSLPPGLFLEQRSGGVAIVGAPSAAGTYSFELRVTDSAGNLGVRNFTIKVSPVMVGENASPAAVANFPYSFQLHGSGGTPPYGWSLASNHSLPPGLSINTTGLISGSPTATGNYRFTILVTDAAGNETAVNLTVKVNALGITSSRALHLALQSSAYSTALTLAGGTPPCTWKASNLPSGLSINSTTGLISGVPTGWGNYNVTITATCANGTTQGSFGLIVRASPAQPLKIQNTTTKYEAPLGYYFTSNSLFAAGGVPPYSWSVAPGSSMPPGLTLFSGTTIPEWMSPYAMAFGGYPTATGTYVFTLRARDSAGASVDQTFTVSVPPLTVMPYPLPSGLLNALYSLMLQAGGGVAPYSWSVVGGALPVGLSLSSAGLLEGTPLETGSFGFRVRIEDSGSPKVISYNSLTIWVNSGTKQTLSLSGASRLNDASLRREYGLNRTASGGTAPYTYALAQGSVLPPGIYMASGADYKILTNESNHGVRFYGAPEVEGFYTFRVIIRDSASPPNMGQRVLSLLVTRIQNRTRAFPVFQLGQPGSAQLSADGGSSPYTWALDPSSTAPPGMSLSATGLLSGTPNQNGKFEFTAVVTDSVSRQAQFRFTAEVRPVAITTGQDLGTVILGLPFSRTITANGGMAPLTWSLPEDDPGIHGLTINSAGVLAGTPDELGSYIITIQVADNEGWVTRKEFHLSVEPPAPSPLALVSQSPLLLGYLTQGIPYDVPLVAHGGVAPYLWSVAPGSSLPPGFTILQGPTLPTPHFVPGVAAYLSGVATAPGSYSFTLTVTDSAGCSKSRTFTMAVNPMTLSPASTLNATFGQPFSYQLHAGGGTAPYHYAIDYPILPGVLPPGLTLSSDGLISGTPTDYGTYSFFVKATDSSLPPRSFIRRINVSIGVSGNPLRWETANRYYALLNGLVIMNLDAAGGTPPYTYRVPAGTELPPGLFLFREDDLVIGFPTVAGNHDFSLQVSDSAGVTRVRNFQLYVTNMSIGPKFLPYGTVGTPYSATLSMSGGTPPRQFLMDVVIPPGLSINSAGVLSGTPTQTGFFDDIQLWMLDNSQPTQVGMAIYPLVINPAGCAFALSSSSMKVTEFGVTGASVNLTAGSNCGWYVAITQPWITIVDGGSHMGNATIVFNVEPNPSTQPRSGEIYIGGIPFTVHQAGLGGISAATARIGTQRSGNWLLDVDGNGAWNAGDKGFAWGWTGTTLVTGDWNGDGHDEAGAFLDGLWVLDYDGNGIFDNGVLDKILYLGAKGCQPLVGDWNGDGRSKIGVYKDGYWFLDYDGNGFWDNGIQDKLLGWGWPGATPMVGDWNGDGRTKIGVYSGGYWFLDYNGNYLWEPLGADKQTGWGWAGVTPLVGDWNGDGRTKISVYKDGFWFMDYDGNYSWDKGVVDRIIGWGWTGTIPVVGDWNGDGRDKVGAFLNGSWFLDYNGNGVWEGFLTDRGYGWGQPGDQPVVGRW